MHRHDRPPPPDATPPTGRRILIVHPHGFCSGVARAVATAETMLARCAPPAYGLHEIVHNEQVTRRLTALGLCFVERLEEIPPGATVLFSAHGVAPSVRAAAQARNLRVIDATCPFVAKVHREVVRFAADGCTVVCIGHRTHAEVIGIAGEAPLQVVVVENAEEAAVVSPPDPGRIALVTQTTLSPEIADHVRDVLCRRFPKLREPAHEDVCYATRNRQQAVREVATRADLVLVLGSANSSNTRRLVETAQHAGGRAHLIGRLADLAAVPLHACRTLGIASGASTPEEFLDAIVSELAAHGFTSVEHLHVVPEPAHAIRLPPL